MTFFKSKSDTSQRTYKAGSTTSVQLAAGADNAKCLGEGTVTVGKMKLPESVHVKHLNTILLSVGQSSQSGRYVTKGTLGFGRRNADELGRSQILDHICGSVQPVHARWPREKLLWHMNCSRRKTS